MPDATALDLGSGVTEAAPELKVAYLTNAYPKVSHSFVRREIRALEELGVTVLRLSVRETTEQLPDLNDQDEKRKTIALIGPHGSLLNMSRSALSRLVRSPLRFFKTGALAATLARGSASGYIRHIAYFMEACRIGDLLQDAGVGHLHVHFGTNPATVARLLKSLCNVTYSFTVHGPDEFDDPRGWKLREKIACAEFTVAISSHGRAQLMRWSEISDWSRIMVVRCGLDRQFLAAPTPIDGKCNRLVCVARLSAQKGIPLLLEAAAAVRAKGHEFELRIVGDGELRSVTEHMIRRHAIGDCVKLLGWQSADRVRAELADCRAFVLPSFAEGLPVVIMEALALGRPVVTTAIAGIPELVDEECGWVVPSGSVQDLAQAMIEALEATAETLNAKGELGRARVAHQHDAMLNAQMLAEAFRKVRQPV